MDFLRACAKRLDDGEDAAPVLQALRDRYTTVRALSVKTCLVRSFCAPNPAHVAALEALVATLEADGRDALAQGVRACAATRRRSHADAEVRALTATLPPRLPPTVLQLRVTRAEMLACKRLGAQGALEKNRRCRRVDGAAVLAHARAVVRDASKHGVFALALGLMLVTGRRTCEVLNGRSRFARADAASEHALHFVGQAKRRREDEEGYVVALLAPVDEVLAAVDVLRAKQDHAVLSNRETSRRYQSGLGRALRASAAFGPCVKVHALRGLYACLAARLFDWGDASHAFVAMHLLGHAGLQESLVYTSFHLDAHNDALPERVDDPVLRAPLEKKEEAGE